MHVLIALLGLIAVASYFIQRTRSTIEAARDIDRETKGLQHKAKGALRVLIGTPLGRVRDPRLGAVVLMIQLVRAEGAMTAEERAAIFELMADPLAVEDREATFEQAWRLTEQRAFFSQVGDELLPLFREKLTGDEREQLVAMLRKAADARGGASDLQRSSIVRLKKRLLA